MIAEKLVVVILSLAAAAIVGCGAESQDLSFSLTITISLVAGGLTGGMAYGAMRSGIALAHRLIGTETENRKQAIADLKTDMNHGFDRIEKTIEWNTRQLIELVQRIQSAHSRPED